MTVAGGRSVSHSSSYLKRDPAVQERQGWGAAERLEGPACSSLEGMGEFVLRNGRMHRRFECVVSSMHLPRRRMWQARVCSPGQAQAQDRCYALLALMISSARTWQQHALGRRTCARTSRAGASLSPGITSRSRPHAGTLANQTLDPSGSSSCESLVS